MYANERSYDYGPDGRESVRVFLERATTLGLLPSAAVDFSA